MPPGKEITQALLARLAPIAFLFWFYRKAFRVWFQQDDFAWLQFRQNLHTASDWLWGLFTPLAQGTVRPISERLFFIWGAEFFFLDPRPMHLVVAATQIANVLLLFSLVMRLLASRAAACLACFLWLCAAGMATPMSWLSTYNQVLISFVFLAGLRAFIAFADSGRARWLAACWTVFVLGFGVLEINVVFPALLTAWSLIYRRELWRRTLPFWILSVIYAVGHVLWASKPAEGVYARHWDLSVPVTLIRYWGGALAAGQLPAAWGWPENSWIWAACGIALALALVFAIRRHHPAARAGLLGALWFCAVLGPVLPLRDHYSDYYLASAFPGIALVFASFAILAWSSGMPGKALLAAAVVVHVGLNAAVNDAVTNWRFDRGQRIRVLVEGLERAAQIHPGKTLFVMGLDRDLFWSCFYDKPYRLFGLHRVYLVPGEESSIGEAPEIGSAAQYIAPKVLLARSLEAETGVVYRYEETALRNVSRRVASTLPSQWLSQRPSFVDVGQPEWSRELVDGWYPIEANGLRWMKQRGSLVLGLPEGGARQLHLAGYCPRGATGEPQVLKVWIGDVKLGEAAVGTGNGSFEIDFPLPPTGLPGREVVVRLEASRRYEFPNDRRELAAAFGKIGFR